EAIDLTDQRVYSLFTRGDTAGIFQFESGGMRDVVMRMKPNRIEDLIAANALFRPGPMEYIPEYIARKHGQAWATPHPIMTDVLSETYGIMVYQEQVSRIVNRLGGLELKAAFRLAKAISKKKTDMIEAMREPFIKGCGENGVRRDVAEQVFADILKFGGYAFNKAHSTGYALVAYQTAWMKTYFPVEFMAALMTFEMVSTEKVAQYREECRSMGISVQPPNVNTSAFDFTIEYNGEATRQQGKEATSSDVDVMTFRRFDISASIRFGLGAIKGVGEKAVAAIVESRTKSGPFKNIFDFCERIDLTAVNKGTIEALIFAGAFDNTGDMRRALFEAVERAMNVGQTAQRDHKRGQMGLFGMGVDEQLTTNGNGHAGLISKNDKNEQSASLTRAEWSESEMLKREKSVLGFYITKHPLTEHEHLLDACASATTADLEKFRDGDKIVIGGIVTNLRTVVTKSGANTGKQVGIVTLEDLSGKVEGVLFADQLPKFRALLTPDEVIFLEGEVDRRRESPSIRISSVVPLDRAVERYAASLLIDISEHPPIEELMRLFSANRGDCRVYLNVPTSDGLIAQIECNPSLRVACTAELIATAVGLTSPNSVRLVSAQRKAIPLALTTQVIHPSIPMALATWV
ncbi:MAG: DNA polymerase III subunit alpha, partial [Planctomycetes bacterium]|nr:DNA polymerase III subunit alpha [Planctomycetota bacterium]